MSKPRSPVHAANTTAWKPFDFLSLSSDAGSAFNGQEFRSQVESGFHRARIEAMPDNSLRAPARWRPPAHEAAPQAPTANPALPAPAPADLPAVDAQQAQDIRDQAFAEGLAQGRREGEAAAEERLRPQIEAAQQQGLQDVRDLLIQLGEAVAGLQQRPDTLHAPLKRLAMHLAEELVLGELGLSASAIDRLVQRCIDAVDGQGAQKLVVELNPQDLAMLQQHPDAEADRPSGWTWQATPDLMPGSVRVRLDEAVVTDLIEHRLQALAKSLLGQTQAWSSRTAFEPSRLAERRRQETPVEDALPRMGTPADSRFEERSTDWATPSDLDETEASDILADEPTHDTPLDVLSTAAHSDDAPLSAEPEALPPEAPTPDDGHA